MNETFKTELEIQEEEKRVNLPVYLRIKPLEGSEDSSLKVIDETTVETNHHSRSNKKATFTRVFEGHVGQQEIFDSTTASLVQRFLDGANVMTFAYGVTSSGKTFTIMGNPSNPGLVPRTLERIFGHYQSKIATTALTYKPVLFEAVHQLKTTEVIELRKTKSSLLAKFKIGKTGFNQYAFQNRTKDRCQEHSLNVTTVSPANSCLVWISVYEIYNEVITDLLCDYNRMKRKTLTIGQDAKGRTFVKDLTQLPVESAAEAYALLRIAKQNLAKAATKMNDNSSRSHMVFNIKMVHWGGSLAEPIVNHFVISDLAGSERQEKTGSSGMLLKQASAINNSLLVLSRCLEALRRKERGISAPFRDSKLTRILNPFFTLEGYVSLIICINPHSSLQDETMDTIRFSAIASEIVQEAIKPLERLRKLRRLTQTCADPELTARQSDDAAAVESWEDAVGAVRTHNGVRYIEIKASYFNDMARDILYAEKQLMANQEEIDSFKTQLKKAETSKENIKCMYQDLMKDQRDKFMLIKTALNEFYENEKATIVESLEEEIGTFEKKYTKYRDGYAKLSAYLKEKLWPEMNLFRERFGYLAEFPPEVDDDCNEVKPENSIQYWKEKLKESDKDNERLKRELSEKSRLLVEKSETCDDLKNALAELQRDKLEKAQAASLEETKVKELGELIHSMRGKCVVAEALEYQVSNLHKDLRIAEETKEFLTAEYEIRINRLKDELVKLSSEVQDETSKASFYSVDSTPGQDLTQSLSADDIEELIKSFTDSIRHLVNSSKCNTSRGKAVEKLDKQINAAKDLRRKIFVSSTPLNESRVVLCLSSYLRETIVQLTQLIESVVAEMETSPRKSDEVTNLEKQRTQEREENRHLKIDNIQLREKVREAQALLAAKESTINAQASEPELSCQKLVVIDGLKTKSKKFHEESLKLRKQMEASRAENRDVHKKNTYTLIENRVISQMERSLETPLTTACVNMVNVSRENPLITREKRPEIPKGRRRIRMANDENSILDKTLQESISDASPVRGFTAFQRKF